MLMRIAWGFPTLWSDCVRVVSVTVLVGGFRESRCLCDDSKHHKIFVGVVHNLLMLYPRCCILLHTGVAAFAFLCHSLIRRWDYKTLKFLFPSTLLPLLLCIFVRYCCCLLFFSSPLSSSSLVLPASCANMDDILAK